MKLATKVGFMISGSHGSRKTTALACAGAGADVVIIFRGATMERRSPLDRSSKPSAGEPRPCIRTTLTLRTTQDLWTKRFVSSV